VVKGAVESPESRQRRWAHSRRIPPLSCCSSPGRAGEWLFLDGFCPAGKTAELGGSTGAEASSPPLGLCRVLGAGALALFRPSLLLRTVIAPGVSGSLVTLGSVFIPLGDVGEGLRRRGLPPSPSSAWCGAQGWQHCAGGKHWLRQPGGEG